MQKQWKATFVVMDSTQLEHGSASHSLIHSHSWYEETDRLPGALR